MYLLKKISSWVVNFDVKQVDKDVIEGLLSVKFINGQHHIITVDQQAEKFRQQVQLLGAKEVHPMGATLNSAVNAFLSKNHNVPA
jgi:ABC-2 type transport system ATP-binding protein